MHGLSLSGDDSRNLESFIRELLKVFGGSLTSSTKTIKAASRSSLPVLPTYKNW